MPEAGEGRRLSLVIADDDAAMRTWLRVVLVRLGIDLHEAASGWELLALLASGRPIDLVISDVRMPAPSGLQVLASARTAGCEAPFLLITAFGDDQLRRRAGALGAAVLDKPFPAAALRRVVAALRGEGSSVPK